MTYVPPHKANPRNTLHFDELIMLAAPTIIALAAAHSFFSGGWRIYIVDALILGVVPRVTYAIVKPMLRATHARKIYGEDIEQ